MNRLRILLNGAEVQTVDLVPGQSFVAGRAQGCQIHLGEQPGISRQHFRLTDESGQWVMHVMSKFGEVLYNGEPVADIMLSQGTAFKVPPYDFVFLSDEAQAEDSHGVMPKHTSEPAPVRNALTPYTGGSPITTSNPSHPPDSRGDEATMVGRFEGVAYVRLSSGNGKAEETLRLEGNLWVAGRDEACEIFLNDAKASRRQFELAMTSEGFFITDLGSANGTLLNGSPLPANEAVALRSGDVINAASVTIHFEVRDPNFKNKLVVISPDLQTPPSLMAAPNHDIFAPPNMYSGPGGVIPLDPNGAPQGSPWSSPQAGAKKFGLDFSQPKTKIMAAVVALLIALAAIFGGNSETPVPPTPAAGADPKKIAFEKLTPPQQKMIKDTYTLARNLVIQQKWELAKDQLLKIHKLLPDGYDESYKIIEDIEQIERDREVRKEIEREQQRVAENKRRFEEILKTCEPVAMRSVSIDEIQNCLNEAVTIDPENPRIQELINRVQMRAESKQEAEAGRREYAALVARRKSLYTQAVQIEKTGSKLAAIQAYQAFLKSPLPDPENLKEKATESMQALRSGISSEVERRLSSARQLNESNKGREAYAELRIAQKIDPDNTEVSAMMEKVVRELNQQLQTIYSDSVIEEGLGNIDDAKGKWRKILEIDRPGGEYYKRAKSKLRQYGNN